MTRSTPLRRLAKRVGIETAYRDVSGAVRHVEDDTLHALLDAMNMLVVDDAGITRQHSALDRSEWLPGLRSVYAVPERDSDAVVDIVFPSGTAGEDYQWELTREDGGTNGNRFKPKDLSLLERKNIEGSTRERRTLWLSEFPIGYHRLTVSGPGVEEGRKGASSILVSCPRRCYLPESRGSGAHSWGLAIQLYALRSQSNWGIGDLGDLAELGSIAGNLGADVVGLNPLHALFPGAPEKYGPYSPSSRLFLNVLYLNVESIPDFIECPAAREMAEAPSFRGILRNLRDASLVEYDGVAALRQPILEALYATFRADHLGSGEVGAATDRGRDFRSFQENGGEDLGRYAVFESLREHFGGTVSWKNWPSAYRDPDSPDVAAFERKHRHRVEFFQYLQWETNRQLSVAADACVRAGMGIGLYGDFALGADPDGAETWGGQSDLADAVHLGAPPDAFNTKGQDWGFPPLDPQVLKQNAYRRFSALLRANMRHFGALRIDHAMSLNRQYWIPAGALPTAGAYVRYPMKDLLGIVALESVRNRCMVIGEDLGTVPEGFREAMADAAVLSYRILYFERDDAGAFKDPADYPALSLAATTTHDLPTIPGFWKGRDLELRRQLDMFPERTSVDRAFEDRARDRVCLLQTLQRNGLIARDIEDEDGIDMRALVRAVYDYLTRASSRLLMVQLEDPLELVEQVNLPGTTDQHPNWRRKLPIFIESMADDERIRSIADLVRDRRGKRLDAPTR